VRQAHGVGRRHGSSSSAAALAVGILSGGKASFVAQDGAPSVPSMFRVLVNSSNTYLGRALVAVGKDLGLDMRTELKDKEKVDLAIVLTAEDDVKRLWRVLDYKGSIVVANNVEGGPTFLDQNILFHTGLSIFRRASMHGFDFETWLQRLKGPQREKLASITEAISASPQGALLTQVPISDSTNRYYHEHLRKQVPP